MEKVVEWGRLATVALPIDIPGRKAPLGKEPSVASPVTGPFITTVGGTGEPKTYIFKSGYKQAKPLDQPLAYEFRTGTTGVKVGSHSYNARSLAAGFDMIGQVNGWDPWTHLENRLYDKFRETVSNNASVGVSLAEIGQSYSMIASRSAQIMGFARRLSRLDFTGAAKILGLAHAPKGVSSKKAFSRNYLEYHFGWSPLIGDMYSVVDVLQNPIKTTKPEARVSEALKRYDLEAPTQGSNPAAYYPTNETWESYRYWLGSRSMSCGAEVFVSNPNLWLANQLGLVNPAVIAWELIPYSFVVDWFTNVGQVLQSFTDFYGLTISRSWTTYHYKGHAKFKNRVTYKWQEWVNGQPVIYRGSNTQSIEGPFIHLRRQTGLPKPVLSIPPYKAPGLRRALAAVSLLTLQLRGR